MVGPFEISLSAEAGRRSRPKSILHRIASPENMRAATPLAWMLAASLLASAAVAEQTVTFRRPVNQDCIRADLPTSDVSLFPEQFLLVGDETVAEPLYTEVGRWPQGRQGCFLPGFTTHHHHLHRTHHLTPAA